MGDEPAAAQRASVGGHSSPALMDLTIFPLCLSSPATQASLVVNGELPRAATSRPHQPLAGTPGVQDPGQLSFCPCPLLLEEVLAEARTLECPQTAD